MKTRTVQILRILRFLSVNVASYEDDFDLKMNEECCEVIIEENFETVEGYEDLNLKFEFWIWVEVGFEECYEDLKTF